MNVRTEIEGTLVYDLVASEDLLEEARDVLERPRMRRYVPESPVPEYIARVRAVALMVLGHFAGDVTSHTEDPDDDYLVELAFAADVDVLVSGPLLPPPQETRMDRAPPARGKRWLCGNVRPGTLLRSPGKRGVARAVAHRR